MRTLVEPLSLHPNPIAGFLQRVSIRSSLIARQLPRLRAPRAYWNWAIANWEWLHKSTRIRARPLKISVDPTNACHLRCPLCPTGRRESERSPTSLDPALFERLMDEVGDFVFFIDFFNWGEPLLNPCVETLISAAASRGIVSTLSTSLSLPLDDARINRLITSGLQDLVVSLDGATPETYAQYRKGGDFALVCENLRRFVAEKRRLGATRPLITWQFLVFRHNEHERQHAQDLARSLGVDRIAFRTPLLDTHRPGLPDPERAGLVSWAPLDEKFRVKRNSETACSWHYMSAAVNADGSVAPCTGAFLKRDDFGSLAAGSRHMDIVNNAAYRSIRSRLAGRPAEPRGLLCEACPVPSIKNQHRRINRQIAMYTAVSLWRALLCVFCAFA